MSELVAVACVVESSLVLAAEWPRLLLEYLSPLLKRLAEAHAANQSMVCSNPYPLCIHITEIHDPVASFSFHNLCHGRYPSYTSAFEEVLCSCPNNNQRAEG